MTTLYRRTYDLRIGRPGEEGRKWTGRGLPEAGEVEGLHITFEVEKKAKRRGDKLRLKMFNLAPESVGFIEQAGNAVTLTAGYEDNDGLLFGGTIARRGVTTTREGVDRVTSIEAGGSELELQRARFSQSFAAGTPRRSVVSAIVSAIGIGSGNLAGVEGLDKTYATGFTYAGPAGDALTEVVQSLGLSWSWSIVDGQLQILELDATTDESAVLLSEDSGLIGVPQRQKGGLELVSLLRPQLRKGRLVEVRSKAISGFYKATQVSHVGDFAGQDWYTRLSARQLK